MAYTVTVLYLTATAVIISHAHDVWKSAAPQLLIVILFVSSCFICFAFIRWQLRNREIAADIVMACSNLLLQMNGKKKHNLSPDKYKRIPLPKMLVDELNSISTNRGFFEGPRVSEWITYSVMLLWSLGVIISLSCAA